MGSLLYLDYLLGLLQDGVIGDLQLVLCEQAVHEQRRLPLPIHLLMVKVVELEVAEQLAGVAFFLQVEGLAVQPLEALDAGAHQLYGLLGHFPLFRLEAVH